MGVSERRAREKEELRGRILDAAAQLFVERGYGHVSMRKIAERIEYSPATIYLHFKDKSNLCQEICAATFDGLTAALARLAEQSLPPVELLKRSFRIYVEFGLDHPQPYIFSFNLPEPPPSPDLRVEDKRKILEVGMRTFDFLRRGLAACMDAGGIRRQDVELAAQTTWFMLHGITSVLITSRSFPLLDRDLLIATYIDRVLLSLQ